MAQTIIAFPTVDGNVLAAEIDANANWFLVLHKNTSSEYSSDSECRIIQLQANDIDQLCVAWQKVKEGNQ